MICLISLNKFSDQLPTFTCMRTIRELLKAFVPELTF